MKPFLTTEEVIEIVREIKGDDSKFYQVKPYYEDQHKYFFENGCRKFLDNNVNLHILTYVICKDEQCVGFYVDLFKIPELRIGNRYDEYVRFIIEMAIKQLDFSVENPNHYENLELN